MFQVLTTWTLKLLPAVRKIWMKAMTAWTLMTATRTLAELLARLARLIGLILLMKPGSLANKKRTRLGGTSMILSTPRPPTDLVLHIPTHPQVDFLHLGHTPPLLFRMEEAIRHSLLFKIKAFLHQGKEPLTTDMVLRVPVAQLIRTAQGRLPTPNLFPGIHLDQTSVNTIREIIMTGPQKLLGSLAIPVPNHREGAHPVLTIMICLDHTRGVLQDQIHHIHLAVLRTWTRTDPNHLERSVEVTAEGISTDQSLPGQSLPSETLIMLILDGTIMDIISEEYIDRAPFTRHNPSLCLGRNSCMTVILRPWPFDLTAN